LLCEYPAKGQVGATGRKTRERKTISAVPNAAWCEARTCNILVAGLVDAFDAQNAGDFADIDENGFELTLVGNFEIGVNAGVGAIRTAFQVVNVGTGFFSADDGGDFGKKASAVARADGELDGKLGFGTAAPLDGDAAFGLVHEILHVGTSSGVHRHTAAAGDVADNFVARNGIATLAR